jgi:hypothetical protein
MLDYTRWFQREIGKIDRRMYDATAKQQQELWLERNRLMNEPGYAERLYRSRQQRNDVPHEGTRRSR